MCKISSEVVNLAKQLSLLPDEKIFEANVVARAKWSATSVWVRRVVAILVSKIDPENKKFKTSEIPIHEIMGTSGGKQYAQIRSVAKELASQTVTIDIQNTPNGFVVFNLFGGSVAYDPKKDTLKIRLNNDLAPYYLELKKNFVAYGLTEFLSLPGVYHQTLFKFLKSWESLPSVTIDIAELHKVMSAAPSLTAHYGRFDQKALRPAHKFINEHTTLQYTYEPQKCGRKVVSVVFTFKSKPKFRKAPKAPVRRSAD